ncbi:MAG TPA: TonB family protein [Tepidisphaeraceae bacterium]|jgi:TonB family protein
MKTQDVPTIPSIPAAPPVAAHQERQTAPPPRREPTFLQVFTLVLWVTCLLVGLLGLWLQGRLHLPKAAPPKPPEPPPMQAELVEVELTPQPATPAAMNSPPPVPDATAEPPPPDVPPALPAVAAPSPTIAFAVPVQGPARIVPAARAAAAAPAWPAPARPAVEHLVYGQGTAAAQPKPDYPTEALAAHEEGVVGIAFTVAPGGRIIEAHVAESCRWPSLNQAALAVVRDEWANPQWVPGHLYLVRLRFKINEL